MDQSILTGVMENPIMEVAVVKTVQKSILRVFGMIYNVPTPTIKVFVKLMEITKLHPR